MDGCASRTRSSPIGPALHDDGGSLYRCQYLTQAMNFSSPYICIPAEVCEFLHITCKSASALPTNQALASHTLFILFKAMALVFGCAVC